MDLLNGLADILTIVTSVTNGVRAAASTLRYRIFSRTGWKYSHVESSSVEDTWRRSEHIPANTSQPKASGLVLDVALLDPSDAPARYSTNHRERLDYRDEVLPNQLRIVPHMAHLETLTNNGIIGPKEVLGRTFSWDWPTLDVKVVNNSSQTIYITRIEVLVKHSLSLPDPLPVFVDDGPHNAFHLDLMNEGWGDMDEVQVSLNIVPYSASMRDRLPSSLSFDSPFRHVYSLGSVSDNINIDLSDAFTAEGVDIEGVRAYRLGSKVYWDNDDSHFRRLNSDNTYSALTLDQFMQLVPKCFGRFRHARAVVFGELTYQWRTTEGIKKLERARFYNVVSLYDEESGTGGGPLPTAQYDIAMRSDGDYYQIQSSANEVLRKGEVDRFTLRISAPRTSEHWFKVRFVYIGGQEVFSRPIRMKTFVPRTDAPHIPEIA